MIYCVQIIECVCPTSNRGLRRTSSIYFAKVGVRNTYSAQDLIGRVLSLLYLYTIGVINLASLRLRFCSPLCGAQLGGIETKPFLLQWHVFVPSTFSIVHSIVACNFLCCSTFVVVATVAVNHTFQQDFERRIRHVLVPLIAFVVRVVAGRNDRPENTVDPFFNVGRRICTGYATVTLMFIQ